MARTFLFDIQFGPHPSDGYPNQCTINVYLEDAGNITCDTIDNTTAAYMLNPSEVTPEELGHPRNVMLTAVCQGTTLRRIFPREFQPFAVAFSDTNSPSCTVVEPCNISGFVLQHSGETVAGLYNGTITAQVDFTKAGTVEYSLDGFNFQASGFFSHLIPGDYTVYARIPGTNCSWSAPVTIEPGEAEVIPEFPWKYRYCHVFKLVRNGVPTYIAEPVKWDSVTIKGKRDMVYHGWLYQYSDGSIDLQFDCPAGMDILVAEYEENGGDGEVTFQYGIEYKGQEWILWEGKINFNTYKIYPGKVSATIERADFNTLFVARTDTLVGMTDTKSVDDVDITPPPVKTFTMHPKELIRQFYYVSDEPVAGNFTANISFREQGAEKGTAFLFFDTNAATISEISKYYAKPLGVSQLDPATAENYYWQMDFGGIYSGSWFSQQDIMFVFYENASDVVEFQLCYRINDNPEVNIGPLLTVPFDSFERKSVNISGTIPPIALAKNDRLFIYTKLNRPDPVHGRPIAWIDVYQIRQDFQLQSLEASPASQGQGWLIFDAIDHIINSVTNGTARLKSRFLSLQNSQQATDGEGSLDMLTNGCQIRQFDPADKPLKLSFKNAMLSLLAESCLGFGIERVADTDFVRIERADFFYQDRQIYVFEDAALNSYYEENIKEWAYNELQIGYEIYQDKGYNTNDEFNTAHTYQTPIKTNKASLAQKSKFIRSGYKIEDVRRQFFVNTSKDAYDNDNDTFAIAMRRDGAGFVPEKDEAFDLVTGVIGAGSVYNLRKSPKRMLYNWAIWLRNIFHFKQGIEKLKNTQAIQNGDMTTQLKATDPAKVGDIDAQVLQEKAEVALDDYTVTRRIFQPVWVYFKSTCTPDIAERINLALMGRSTDAYNYGYVTVKNDKGEYIAGYPFELDYNFVSEEITIKMLKRWVNPVDPDANCCPPLAVNGCVLLVNGQPLYIKKLS